MQNPFFRITMQAGAYSGLSLFGLFILLYFFVSTPLGNWSYAGFWIPVVFIRMGILHYRKEAGEGFVGYGRALLVGMATGIFSSILYGLLVFIFGTLVDPLILDNFKEETLKGIEEGMKYMQGGQLAGMMEKAILEIEKMGMEDISLSVFYNGSLYGFFISLIAAGILKKSKPFFESTQEGQVNS